MIDMSNTICQGGSFEPEQGNLVVYRDNCHLTESYAESLAGELHKRLMEDSNQGLFPRSINSLWGRSVRLAKLVGVAHAPGPGHGSRYLSKVNSAGSKMHTAGLLFEVGLRYAFNPDVETVIAWRDGAKDECVACICDSIKRG